MLKKHQKTTQDTDAKRDPPPTTTSEIQPASVEQRVDDILTKRSRKTTKPPQTTSQHNLFSIHQHTTSQPRKNAQFFVKRKTILQKSTETTPTKSRISFHRKPREPKKNHQFFTKEKTITQKPTETTPTKTTFSFHRKPREPKKHHKFLTKDKTTAQKPTEDIPPKPTFSFHRKPHEPKKNILFFVKNKDKKNDPKLTLPKTSHKTPKTAKHTTQKPTPSPDATQQQPDTQPNDDDAINQFPEYLPAINPDEASWVDQKLKETITNQPFEPPEKPSQIQPHPTKPKDAEPTPKPTPLSPTKPVEEPPQEPLDTTQPSQETQTAPAPEAPAPPPKPSPATRFAGLAPDGQVQYQDIAQQLKTQTLTQLGYNQQAIEEIDFYPLQEPYAYVQVVREQDSLDKRYILVEVQLNDEENRLFSFLKTSFATMPFHTIEIEEIGGHEYLIRKVDEILNDYMIPITPEIKEKLIYFLEKEFLGLGKLEILMKDSNIEDISCDGVNIPIFLYHRHFGSLQSNVEFTEEDQLTAFVVKLAQKCGKHISVAEPMLDATMPDGSRIQMTLSTEVTTKGSTFTIRKFSEDPFSPTDLVEFHTMSSEMVAFMWLAIENGINALIAGGTAAGKTSTLNALSLFIPRESKIVSIEETREINLPHPNWIPGVVRSGFGEVVGNKVVGEIDLYDLMKAALRQRPEYIIVGEIRGKEAYVLFQAMATGHTTYSTVHADSAQSLIHRLEGKPIEIPRIMLQALDLICIQVISRVKNKRARRCKQIIEIIDIDPTTKEILTNEVFHWDPIEDKFNYSGKSYILERIRSEKDITREEMIQEIKNRALLIEWMNKENYREFKKVATIIAQYADNPADTMKKVIGQS
jgi:flagellar protein FlaI